MEPGDAGLELGCEKLRQQLGTRISHMRSDAEITIHKLSALHNRKLSKLN